MDLAHPLCVTLCQVIIDCDHMHTLSLQGIQVGRQGSHQGLTFTGTHLRDTSLVHDDAADKLYPEMFHIQHSPGRLPDSGKGIRKNVIQGLSLLQAFPELLCPGTQRLIR